jgi:hypothetical protein
MLLFLECFDLCFVLKGAGYVRCIAQRAFTRSYVVHGDTSYPSDNSHLWMLDDNMSVMYDLEECAAEVIAEQTTRSTGGHAKKGATRRWVRVQTTFKTALLAVQVKQMETGADLVGCVRDAGHAVCKRRRWLAQNISIYKVLLLDLSSLRDRGAHFQAHLDMLEDVCFAAQIIDRGGRTLKCQQYTCLS